MKQFLKIGVQVTKIVLQVCFNFDLLGVAAPKVQSQSPLVQLYDEMFSKRKQAKNDLKKKRTFLLSGMAIDRETNPS